MNQGYKTEYKCHKNNISNKSYTLEVGEGKIILAARLIPSKQKSEILVSGNNGAKEQPTDTDTQGFSGRQGSNSTLGNSEAHQLSLASHAQ